MDRASIEDTRERTSDSALWECGRPSTWFHFAPESVLEHRSLQRIAAWLEDDEHRRGLHDSQLRGDYPRHAIDALGKLGLSELLGREATVWHSSALNALLASVDGSLAITIGVNFLALLPIHLDASPALQESVFRRVQEGAFASLLLTEWDHGSNLVRNETRAEPKADRYVVRGTKQLINGGREHQILMVLARSDDRGAGGALSAHTLFAIERSDGVRFVSRWRTLPTRGADISNVDIDIAVANTRIVGAPGEGFSVIRRTLLLSRGGVAALAAGAAAGAVDMTRRYAEERDVYGRPILELDAIGNGVAAAMEAEAVSAAASLRAVAWANAFGMAAATQTAAAKVVGTVYAEKAIEEGRRVLASRALLEDLPYAAFARDVLLYGVFDGTIHVMLEELAFRFERFATAGPDGKDPMSQERHAWTCEPRLLSECGANVPVARLDLRRLAAEIDGCATWPAAECLPALVEALLSVHADLARGERRLPQSLRFELGELYALLETACGMFVMGDPGVRVRIGLSAPFRVDADGVIRTIAFESGAASLCCTIAERLARVRRSRGGQVESTFAALGRATAVASQLRAKLVGELSSLKRAGA
jgi:alkylation response protein AidB-like acyl-CoA dehydrogenase